MHEWKTKAFEVAIVLVAIALAGRLAWVILEPAVPVLVVLVGLIVVYGLIFRKQD